MENMIVNSDELMAAERELKWRVAEAERAKLRRAAEKEHQKRELAAAAVKKVLTEGEVGMLVPDWKVLVMYIAPLDGKVDSYECQ